MTTSSDVLHPPLPLERHGRRRPQQPEVVLVHGVGFGPWVMDEVASRLSSTCAVAVVDRPGYGSLAAEPAIDLDLGVERLASTLRCSAAHTGVAPVLVGVSGGATLGLAVLLRYPHLVDVAVLHEPLLGPAAPALHEAVTDAAARLAATPGCAAAAGFVAELVGLTTWKALSSTERDGVLAVADVIRAEVTAFVGFTVDLGDLEALAAVPVSIVSSVGEHSAPTRHEAAAVLAAAVGVSPRVLAGSGHLAPADAPDALADLVVDVVGRP
ncbi:MAG: alpha/beta fold hydrolase [Acidimicrobiia bacterium]|nr:alpha/beta fold hydrolase [Acidimicrobiia bacterium]